MQEGINIASNNYNKLLWNVWDFYNKNEKAQFSNNYSQNMKIY